MRDDQGPNQSHVDDDHDDQLADEANQLVDEDDQLVDEDDQENDDIWTTPTLTSSVFEPRRTRSDFSAGPVLYLFGSHKSFTPGTNHYVYHYTRHQPLTWYQLTIVSPSHTHSQSSPSKSVVHTLCCVTQLCIHMVETNWNLNTGCNSPFPADWSAVCIFRQEPFFSVYVYVPLCTHCI